ncbi:MAG TPA: c-type cytochrome [Gemmatimonadales bacterium]|nr:c-type cytochrome [Gemmatimonadales bacterium]
MTGRAAWLLTFTLLGAAPLAAQQQGGARMTRGAETGVDTHEDGQPAKLPSLPSGMTVAMIRQGDSLFRGKGGCQTCHGQEASGMPDMGSGLTSGLLFIPAEWQRIDSLIQAGIPEPITRTSIAMPARGATSNLTPEESRLIAAYVWAISQTKGEPWPGGHKIHGQQNQQGQEAAQAE